MDIQIFSPSYQIIAEDKVECKEQNSMEKLGMKDKPNFYFVIFKMSIIDNNIKNITRDLKHDKVENEVWWYIYFLQAHTLLTAIKSESDKSVWDW